MIYTYSNITPKMALKWYLFTFLLNTFFAIFFWSLSGKYPFMYHFIFSQCQGFSILNFGAFANMVFKNTGPTIRLIGIFIFSMTGSVAGKFLAPVILDERFLSYPELLFLFLINLLIISIIIGFLYYWEGISITQSKIQEERKKRLELEKKIAQSRLKLLQTQIDPGFLFNTLYAVLNLLETEPEQAKGVQLDLIHYMRLSLANFKKETHTVGREIEMIRIYLNIIQTLKHKKLNFQIDVDENADETIIPTMLVHSLVDKIANLEPALSGGDQITVRARNLSHKLRFEAIRSGFGNFLNSQQMKCFDDVRHRLNKLFGDHGLFLLKNDEFGNLKAVMEFGIREQSEKPLQKIPNKNSCCKLQRIPAHALKPV